MEMESFKINYLPTKMLKANLHTGTSNTQVQDIYSEIAQIKAGFGSRLSQIQDSYKYNHQNQGSAGTGNTKINLLTTIQILHKVQTVI